MQLSHCLAQTSSNDCCPSNPSISFILGPHIAGSLRPPRVCEIFSFNEFVRYGQHRPMGNCIIFFTKVVVG